MQGAPIDQLNMGLRSFKDELVSDSLAAKRVEVAVLTFGDQVRLVSDFTDAATFEPPVLTAGGLTPMGAAIWDALGRLTARKETYRTNGVGYYRPWVFLITDGEPTDEYETAAAKVREGERLRFRDLFVWLSKSMRTVSHSAIGQTISLEPPGWITTQA
jgi:uncharacterized protein YegL